MEAKTAQGDCRPVENPGEPISREQYIEYITERLADMSLKSLRAVYHFTLFI